MASTADLPGNPDHDMEEAQANIKKAAEPVLESYRANGVMDAPGNAVWESLAIEGPSV